MMVANSRAPPWSRRELHSGVASRSSKSRIARTAAKMFFDGLNGTAHLQEVMPSVVDFLDICLDGRGVIDETFGDFRGRADLAVYAPVLRRRSCSVQPDSPSESSFLYLLHPEKGIHARIIGHTSVSAGKLEKGRRSGDSNEFLKLPGPQANSWCCGRRRRLSSGCRARQDRRCRAARYPASTWQAAPILKT